MTDTTIAQATIAIPLETAIRGLNAVLPHIGKDEMTPILSNVLLTGDAFLATNRNTLARFRHGVTVEDPDFQVILPRDAALWLTKITPTQLDTDKSAIKHMYARFTETSVSVHFIDCQTDPRATHEFAPVETQFGFPPVNRLFNNWNPATEPVIPTFNADELAMFTTSAKKLTSSKRRDDLAIKIECSQPASNSSYAGPVHITIGDDFDGLIMPLRRNR